MTTATSGVIARFPLLLPVRNSVASYGASAVARTSDRGHVAEAINQYRSGGVSIQYSVFSNCSSTVTVSPSGPRKLFKGVTTAMSGVIDRFPLLLPVRNPAVGYGASAVTRTPDRGHVAEVKNQCHGVAGSQFGFPKKPFSPLMSNRFSGSSMHMLKTIYQRCGMRMKVNTMDVRMRLGDAIDPCHLANGFEAVIGYECQERSNPPFSHPHDTYKSCKV
jgi:hypothetical protein